MTVRVRVPPSRRIPSLPGTAEMNRSRAVAGLAKMLPRSRSCRNLTLRMQARPIPSPNLASVPSRVSVPRVPTRALTCRPLRPSGVGRRRGPRPPFPTRIRTPLQGSTRKMAARQRVRASHRHRREVSRVAGMDAAPPTVDRRGRQPTPIPPQHRSTPPARRSAARNQNEAGPCRLGRCGGHPECPTHGRRWARCPATTRRQHRAEQTICPPWADRPTVTLRLRRPLPRRRVRHRNPNRRPTAGPPGRNGRRPCP